MTVNELLARYAVLKRLNPRSISLYRGTLARFAEHVGHEPTVADLDDLVVSEFLIARSTQPCRGRTLSPASVEKDRCQLLAIWRYGARKRLVAEFPDVQRWKVPKRVKDAYTVSHLERLLEACGRLRGQRRTAPGVPAAWWWRTFVRTAYETGERKGGLLGLRWRDVDLDAGRVVFRAETRKGGREDIVRAITPSLAAELRQHVGPPDAPVWPWVGHATSLYPALRRLCTAAGVPYHAVHGVRRTSASYVARGGGDAAAHLGHSSPEITREHYLVPSIVGGRGAIDCLPSLGGDSDAAEFIPDPEPTSSP